ncbi:DUF4258 domain-containing protein [Thiorhodococcus mannitoliphagus]|uniref:DUF4258 domain-containing protein n=1 Tax=Thiorhodococcus mannitoliphagus TaxID=329406 RepID=UPI003B82D07A
MIDALRRGAITSTYPDDRPIPSALIYDAHERPLQVVVALDVNATTCFIITAYCPDEIHVESDMKTTQPR